MQVFTANYSRTFRLADRPFPVKALDPAYVARSQQNAIRRLDLAVLRPVLEAHLVTGEPWWQTHIREEERIPGGHGVGLSKTRVGQQRFREAMLDRFGEACAFTGPQPPGALEAAHLYLYSKNPEHDVRGGLLLRCRPARAVRQVAHHHRPRYLVNPDRTRTQALSRPRRARRPGHPAARRPTAAAQVHSRTRDGGSSVLELTLVALVLVVSCIGAYAPAFPWGFILSPSATLRVAGLASRVKVEHPTV